MSSHTVEIKRGRHARRQNTATTAHMSNMNIKLDTAIDDEIHFLISCSDLSTQITNLLAESKLHNTEFDSLSNDEKILCGPTAMSSTHRPLVIYASKIHLHQF